MPFNCVSLYRVKKPSINFSIYHIWGVTDVTNVIWTVLEPMSNEASNDAKYSGFCAFPRNKKRPFLQP